MTKQGRDASVFTLTVLTAAIGAGTASEANAQSYSTAPSGFVPIVFSTALPTMDRTFDFDNNGVADFRISRTSTTIALTALQTSTSFSGFGNINAYNDTSSFQPVTSLKSNAGGNTTNNFVSMNPNAAFSNFTSGMPQFAEIGINLTYDPNGVITGGQRGYFAVTRNTTGAGGTDGGQIETFTISDYGLLGAAPEPSTWLLMTLGFGAVGGALRRRRRAADRGLALAA